MIDSNLAGAKRMSSAVKRARPDARVILLSRPPEADRISNMLLHAGIQ